MMLKKPCSTCVRGPLWLNADGFPGQWKRPDCPTRPYRGNCVSWEWAGFLTIYDEKAE